MLFNMQQGEDWRWLLSVLEGMQMVKEYIVSNGIKLLDSPSWGVRKINSMLVF